MDNKNLFRLFIDDSEKGKRALLLNEARHLTGCDRSLAETAIHKFPGEWVSAGTTSMIWMQGEPASWAPSYDPKIDGYLVRAVDDDRDGIRHSSLWSLDGRTYLGVVCDNPESDCFVEGSDEWRPGDVVKLDGVQPK